VGTGQVSLHYFGVPQNYVRSLPVRPAGLLHKLCLVLREVKLVLGQVVVGVDGKSGLKVGGLGGVDEDHSSRQKLDVAGTESTETLKAAQLILAEQLLTACKNILHRGGMVWLSSRETDILNQ
jgi:hypothetical protein